VHILVTNHGLDRPAGTETFVLTVAAELISRGHQVSCYAAELGEAAERLRALGARTTDDARAVDEPDVIHASHIDVTHSVMAAWPLAPMVFLSHGSGLREVLERPPLARSQVERWAAVSEWVRDVLATRDGIAPGDVHVVRNPVDLDRFRALLPPRRPARTALLLNNHDDPAFVALVEEGCRTAGLELRRVGGSVRRWDTADEINNADVVISIGRGAIEALACERPVVLLHLFGGDGPLVPATADRAMRINYAGLHDHRIPSAGELGDWLREAVEAGGEWGRAWIEEHHAAPRVVDALVDLYEGAMADAAARLARDGVEAVLRDRLASLYPSVRWARRAGDRQDWLRGALPFPVWAPDVGPELDDLLNAMKAHVDTLTERLSMSEEHAAGLERALDEARTELDAIRTTRTFRAQQRMAAIRQRARRGESG
jgi:hypothetical protein